MLSQNIKVMTPLVFLFLLSSCASDSKHHADQSEIPLSINKDDSKPKQEFQISDEHRSITRDSIENQRSIYQEEQENPLVESSERKQYLLEQIFKLLIKIQNTYKDHKIEGFKLWSMAKYMQTRSAIENNLKFAFLDNANNGITRKFLLDDLKIYVNEMDSYLKKVKK